MEKEVMKRLEDIRNENATLYERIAELKKIPSNASVESEQDETVEFYSKKLEEERAEVIKLKKTYSELLSEKNKLDVEIDQKEFYLNHDLIPNLKQEEANNFNYNSSLVTQIEKIPEVDIESLKKLLSAVQIKRDHVMNMRDEFEKVKQFIEINRFTTEIKNKQQEVAVEKVKSKLPVPRSSPLRIATESQATKPHRRHVVFNIQ